MVKFLIGLTSAATLLLGFGEHLVGKWESVVRSKTGVGITLELRSDGTASWTNDTLSEVNYRLEGHYLVTFIANTGRASEPEPEEEGENEGVPAERRYTFGVHGDGLTLADPATGRQVVRMTRLTHPHSEDPPIVGSWSYEYLSGRTACQEFTRDGRILFRLPGKSETGSYSTSGDSLRLNLKPPTTWRFKLEYPGILILKPEGGPELRFRRP